jgi:bacterioferritin-associated ferredoxin
MIVCICNNVSEREIAREAASGCGTFSALQEKLKVGTTCGNCTDCALDTWRTHARRAMPAQDSPVSKGSFATA